MTSRITEGDVESRIAWPILTRADLLGIPSQQIASKRYVPSRDIGKGSAFVKGFAPDYLVYSNRVPVFAIEAKAPDETAELAYAQARLYANEINSAYPSGQNPVKWVLGTNGTTVLFGQTDAQPTVVWQLDGDLVPCAETSEIAAQVGWSALHAQGLLIGASLDRERYFSASFLFGGQARLNRRLGQNSLSDVLAPVVRRYFDTESPEEKDEILEKAYVDSDLTTRYARSFESFLKERTIPVQAPQIKPVEPHKRDEKHFTSALADYNLSLPTRGSVQILIGAVGAGKSTFIERFQRYLLPEALRENLFWVYANFNDAPPDPSKYEAWVCEKLVTAFKEKYFRGDPQIQLAVFADRKRDFDFANFLIKDNDPHEYNRRLSIELSDWSRDPRIFAESAARYLIGDRRTGIVCVFDNTDRGTREQQLRLFEVAEWFKAQTRACCVIALRDETYERYKNEPPLDAFVYSNHFYIRSPRFIDIVRKRLQLSMAALASAPITTSVAGVGKIIIPPERVSAFLDAVFRYLFSSSSRKISWITEGLSGKSARTALRMFARLIYSPHIDERHFVSISEGYPDKSIPERSILNALMKTDYLYYSEDHGFVSNIFDFSSGSATGDNFLRSEILQFFVDRRKFIGDIGIEGYYQVSSICEKMTSLGYDASDVLLELNWAVSRGLLTSDQFVDRHVVETDVLKAHASAYVHMSLLTKRLEYVANCALTMKIFNRPMAERIADIWNITRDDFDISFDRKKEIAKLTRDYLATWLQRRSSIFPLSVGSSTAAERLLESLEKILEYQILDPNALPLGLKGKALAPRKQR
jgi:GTPase SAR1 family protein